jgi:hypothetical protein
MWEGTSCHYAKVEVVEPFKLHTTSISYIYKVFEQPFLWTMIKWMHTHTITTTNSPPDLGKLLAEIEGNVSVENMPLNHVGGCKTFQNASHIHVIHIKGV